jgi:hypothetical protein
MSAAGRIVREGGAIIMAAACADGLPDHGSTQLLLAEAGSPRGVLDLLARPGFCEHDQWQCRFRPDSTARSGSRLQRQPERRADSTRFVHALPRSGSDGCRLRQQYGPRLAVMPDGPQTIATLETAN